MQLQELTGDDVVARERVRLSAVPRERVTGYWLARTIAGTAAADVVPDPVADEVDRRLVPQRVDQPLLRQNAVLATGFRAWNRPARPGPTGRHVTPSPSEHDDRHIVRVEARQSAGGADRPPRLGLVRSPIP